MKEPLHFKTRQNFRDWLFKNALAKEGVWLLFDKTKDGLTLKANEALAEALCFGWIDGVMKRIDDQTYIKYFSQRRTNSKWSEKNKSLVAQLEKQNLLTSYGRKKIEEAKDNGQWDKATTPSAISEEEIHGLSTLLSANEVAFTNFQTMPPSIQKTYTRAYCDAKTDAGRIKRLQWIIERLEKNLKPM